MTLREAVARSGVVGGGGAGFPTHAKWEGAVEHLILNGVECEPLLHTDRYLMRHCATEILTAAAAMQSELGAAQCTIAVKGEYTREIQGLSAAAEQLGIELQLHRMGSFYPAGDEQAVVQAVTGKTVPPAGIPLDVGVVVQNVATALAVYEAARGIPLTHKYVTVAGEVGAPAVLRVPIGTLFSDCIRYAGGAKSRDCLVVSGGPMMGEAMPMQQALQEVVTKTTSGILLLPRGALPGREPIPVEHMKNRAAAACIQCSYCTQFCPRYLLGHPLHPHKIMRKLALASSIDDLLADADIQAAALCCECGVCEVYACPMELQPRQINAMFKQMLARQGIRYPKGAGGQNPRPEWATHKIPSGRIAARAGVGAYVRYPIDTLVQATPDRVEIPLRQHIGAPSTPVVKPGDTVTAGQLIAACPADTLGAHIHASMAGTVEAVSDRIAITGRGEPT